MCVVVAVSWEKECADRPEQDRSYCTLPTSCEVYFEQTMGRRVPVVAELVDAVHVG